MATGQRKILKMTPYYDPLLIKGNKVPQNCAPLTFWPTAIWRRVKTLVLQWTLQKPFQKTSKVHKRYPFSFDPPSLCTSLLYITRKCKKKKSQPPGCRHRTTTWSDKTWWPAHKGLWQIDGNAMETHWKLYMWKAIWKHRNGHFLGASIEMTTLVWFLCCLFMSVLWFAMQANQYKIQTNMKTTCGWLDCLVSSGKPGLCFFKRKPLPPVLPAFSNSLVFQEHQHALQQQLCNEPQGRAWCLLFSFATAMHGCILREPQKIKGKIV